MILEVLHLPSTIFSWVHCFELRKISNFADCMRRHRSRGEKFKKFVMKVAEKCLEENSSGGGNRVDRRIFITKIVKLNNYQ